MVSSNNPDISIQSAELSDHQSVTRRKFDKFRAKFMELFSFSTNNNTTPTPLTPQSSPKLATSSTSTPETAASLKRRKSSSTSSNNSSTNSESQFHNNTNNAMLISNYYYGYKTINYNDSEDSFYTKTKAKKINASKSSSKLKSTNVTCSSSSSSSDDTSSSSLKLNTSHQINQIKLPPSGTIMIDSLNYDSFSMNTNSFDFNFNYDNENSNSNSNSNYYDEEHVRNRNPFLNKSLTSLISFNSDLSTIEAYFQAHLHLIDGKFDDLLFSL
jgi:hypothetical protein